MSKVRTIAAVGGRGPPPHPPPGGVWGGRGHHRIRRRRRCCARRGHHKAGSGTGGKSTNNCLQLVVSIVNGAISGVGLAPVSCKASANGTGGAANGKAAY